MMETMLGWLRLMKERFETSNWRTQTSVALDSWALSLGKIVGRSITSLLRERSLETNLLGGSLVKMGSTTTLLNSQYHLTSTHQLCAHQLLWMLLPILSLVVSRG
ncbi:hypothetical protein AUR66_18155 [Haloferax profundi]|uniref:Uncharacterized protein n=1 Tax=Haloferax profundi TaxID=1544718 RepID=A0A0W1RYZ9_9EURY|nr:hypothetical protein AUR66_18155 [Haloferax profundi]